MVGMSKLALAKRSLNRWKRRLIKREARLQKLRIKIGDSQRVARVAQRRINKIKDKLAAKETAPTELSDAGVKFIAEFEGWYEKPYNDPVGHCTIGYGHLIHHGPCTASDRQEWGQISKQKGLELLRQDAAVAIKAINDGVKVPLNQAQFDALVSFVFNVGATAFAESTLLKKLNAGDYQGAGNQLMRWVYASGRVLPGLQRRRLAEREMFLGL
jgi:lysozyme